MAMNNIRYHYVACLIVFVFILLSVHQIHFLNVWGDESFSLILASKTFSEIVTTVDVHTPTYYLLLKYILFFTGVHYSAELYIRLVHICLFAGGLIFSYKILDVYKRSGTNLLTLAFACLIPAFLFYASNIRMYAPQFLLQMGFLYQVIKILSDSPDHHSYRLHFFFFLFGILLLLVDYVGWVYYGLGIFFILLHHQRWRHVNSWVQILIPILIAIGILHDSLWNNLKVLAAWPSFAHLNSTNSVSLIKMALIKIFKSVRPVIDLTDSSFKNFVFPVATLLAYGFFLMIGSIQLIKHYLKTKDLKHLFILTLAYLWFGTILLGSSITRLFLPSQFFIAFLIIQGVTAKPFIDAKNSLFALLISFNLYLAIFPNEHLVARIPYYQIAQDIVLQAKEKNINLIMLSANSLNYVSIKRYINEIDPRFVVDEMDAENPKKDFLQPFLFVSYLNEDSRFIDPQVVAKNLNKRLIFLKGYVELSALPYNVLWKKNILENARQKYVYQIYELR